MQMVEKRTLMREIRRKEGLVEVEGRTIRLLQVEAWPGPPRAAERRVACELP